ncbi:hypothetical protein PUMCH_000020 [Australozyma saopauloensis]|uniref:ATP-dependent RNA helicase n=1 Tax=Australozyma saopauloensis TaxID=291208 RepID=A0AAX4H3P8_9ASCO|nr:hypothetical protein PUMCH_000020 [[Candida] saopauloensis]
MLITTTMFAPRFDPDAEVVEKASSKVLLRKRKLSNASVDLEADNSGEEDSSSDSSSDSSDSSSDSSDSSDSESDNEEDTQTPIPETPLNSVLTEDNMDVDLPEAQSQASEYNADAQMEEIVAADDDYTSRHSKIFDKFKNIRALESAGNDTESMEDVPTQQLTPMPQPELPKDEELIATLTYLKNLDWLAKPAYSAPGTVRPFSDFDLSPLIQKNLAKLGYKEAFSVQLSVLKILLEDIKKNKLSPDFRGDVLVNSSTGSGKTLAYAIPIVQALQNRTVPRVRAIVLVPTKPLIVQVATTLRELSQGTSLSIVNLTNDRSLKEEASRLRANVPDVIVTTPGRLVDHLSLGSVSLEALRFLIVDEADRLLSLSYQDWSQVVVSHIEKYFGTSRNLATTWNLAPQKLIFSATLTTDAGKMAMLKLSKPRLVVVNSVDRPMTEMFSVPTTLTEYKLKFLSLQTVQKPLLLLKFLLSTHRFNSVLIFAKSNDATIRLTKIFNELLPKLCVGKKMTAAFLNSTNNQSSIRSRILRDFDEKKVNFLVATDLISRGIDVSSISCVVNYDLPSSARDFVHRVGRTARANSSGDAVSMCFGDGELKWFETLMNDVGRSGMVYEVEAPHTERFEEKIYDDVMEEFQKSL